MLDAFRYLLCSKLCQHNRLAGAYIRGGVNFQFSIYSKKLTLANTENFSESRADTKLSEVRIIV